MGIFSFVKPGKQTFKTITSVTPKVNNSKLDKAKSKLAIAIQKTKTSGAKLKQTLFESKNKAFKGDDFTFATNKKKTLSNTEKQKLKEGLYGGGSKVTKKATGGRVGRRFGSPKPKTNVEKIKETFATKNKNLKPVDKKKQKGLAKLPIEVRNKMGYAKKGGVV
jgi:hypothetical protein